MVFHTFCIFFILEHTILHSAALYHTFVNKMLKLIFQPPDAIELPPVTITIQIGSKCAASHYIIELVNTEAKPHLERSSKDANPIQ